MNDPTEEEAFALRKAAVIIWTTSLREAFPETANRLNEAADEYDAPYACEGCMAPTRSTDDEGVALCDSCAQED